MFDIFHQVFEHAGAGCNVQPREEEKEDDGTKVDADEEIRFDMQKVHV